MGEVSDSNQAIALSFAADTEFMHLSYTEILLKALISVRPRVSVL